jgi:hypothetical protein
MLRHPARAFLLSVLLLAGSAAAEEPSTPRVGIKLLPFSGLTIPHQDIDDHSVGVPVGLGLEVYYLPGATFTLDYTFSLHGDLQINSLQLLGRWWFPREEWSLFLQGGAGFYQAEIDEDDGEDQFGGFGVSFGAGLDYPVGNNFHLQAELRSNWAEGEENSGNADDIWIGHTQALVWLVYRLP